jgi:adenine deaminase
MLFRKNEGTNNMAIQKGFHSTKESLKTAIKVAKGEQKADLVIKNAKVLDVFNGCFVQGDVAINSGAIVGIMETYKGKAEIDAKGSYLVPGFIDAHVHIESSLMTPAQFQRAILPRGTTSVIWDPHEITNVKGMEGIQWALKSAENLLLDIFVMLPSCVPSTSPELNLETSGAVLYPHDLTVFRTRPGVLGLAEMMNYPGLLACDDDVLDKMMDFKKLKRDGHCPGLSGKTLNAYAAAGIHSDHESTTLEEAREKLAKGIFCLIREGSCAKNADALLPILNAYTSTVVALCSDDRNPADIFTEGHIDFIINKALKLGHSPEDVFRAASFSPAKIYDLEDRGAIAPGYKADFCLVKPNKNNWENGMKVQSVYKNGLLINSDNIPKNREFGFNGKNIHIASCHIIDFQVPAKNSAKQHVKVVGVQPGQILTDELEAELSVISGEVEADISQDILKIAVFERHHATGNHAVGFVKGFNIKNGAIASSINHDSHNVIVVGSTDEAMLDAVRTLIDIDGGIVVVDDEGNHTILPLPIGGLMSNSSPEDVYDHLMQLKKMAKKIGCTLEEPFLQLAFLALPVVPSLKITDRGLIDVNQFKKVAVVL